MKGKENVNPCERKLRKTERNVSFRSTPMARRGSKMLQAALDVSKPTLFAKGDAKNINTTQKRKRDTYNDTEMSATKRRYMVRKLMAPSEKMQTRSQNKTSPKQEPNRTHNKSAPEDTESENASPHNIKDQSCLQRLTVPFANLHISVNRSHLTHDDIDHRNRHKMFECSEYAFGIFEYMRMRQDVFTISSNFIEIVQKEITTDMRAVVVNWMVQVLEHLHLKNEVLHLSVNILDLFLQKVSVPRTKLQLVGVTALFIATKFEHSRHPNASDFLYFCADAYTKEQLIYMELFILSKVGFDINIPLSYAFIRRFAKCARVNMETLILGRYLLELALVDYDFVAVKSSMLAAAALWLAVNMKKYDNIWDDTMVYYTCYRESDLFPLCRQLNELVRSAEHYKLQAVRVKYSASVLYCVSSAPPLTKAHLSQEEERITQETATCKKYEIIGLI